MLNLLLDERAVHLPSDFSMTMNLKNPIFNDAGSYSYPFKIPNSPLNQFLTSHINRIEGTTSPYKEFDGKIFWNDILLFRGTSKFKIMNDKSFEGSIYDSEGDFNYKRKNASLREFITLKYHFSSDSNALSWINSCRGQRYPDYHVSFPMIYNETYFEDLPVDEELHYFNHQDGDGVISKLTALGNKTVIVPFYYLRHAIDDVFSSLGYTIPEKDNFFASDEIFRKLVIFNSLSINGYCPDFNYNILDIFMNLHVPNISLNEFLTSLEKFFGLRFFIDEITKVVRIISINSVLDDPAYVNFDQSILAKSTELEEQINGFLVECKTDSGDAYAETLITQQENYFKSLKEEVETYSDLPAWPLAEVGDIRYVTSESAYYILSTGETPSWVSIIPLYFSKRFYHDKTNPLDLAMSSLVPTNLQGYDQIVICGNALADWKDTKFRVFFTRTYADHEVRGYAWDDEFSLWLKDESSIAAYSLFTNCHKKFIDFKMSTRLVKFSKQMSLQEFVDLDFSKKIMIQGVKYLIKSIQVVFKKDRIMPATLECYKC